MCRGFLPQLETQAGTTNCERKSPPGVDLPRTVYNILLPGDMVLFANAGKLPCLVPVLEIAKKLC
jgi:hypothetical protein